MRRLMLTTSLLAVALAQPLAALAADLPTLVSTPMSAEDSAGIDTIANATLESAGIDALYVGVWDPARGAFVKAYGTADVATGRPASIDDSFRIGSTTKTFTATVILQLVDEGKLALDATLAEAAPGVAKKYPTIADRTIEQLLSMTGGIPDYTEVPDGVVAGVAADPSRVWTADEIIASGLTQPLTPVGTTAYSSTSYLLLQEVAEEVGGAPLAQLIADRVTGPLGLTHTVLPPDTDTTLPEPSAHGYIGEACAAQIAALGGTVTADTDSTDWNVSYTQGSGGITSTLVDLGTWAASMSGSSLLSPELAAQRVDFGKSPDGLPSYGLGIMGAGPMWGHSGEVFGWEGYAFHDPATGATVVIYSNSCGTGAPLSVLITAYAPLLDWITKLTGG